MKKYDFYLLAVYVCPVVLFLLAIGGYYRTERRGLEKGVHYFEKIYRTPIKTVLIKDPGIRVEKRGKGGTHSENGLDFFGHFDVRYLDNLKISGDTLVISGGIRFDLALRVDTVSGPVLQVERPLTEQEGD